MNDCIYLGAVARLSFLLVGGVGGDGTDLCTVDQTLADTREAGDTTAPVVGSADTTCSERRIQKLYNSIISL